ncbi:hypothetical protein T439DRAFT_322809 [Meredithblackwellia eburnea MCA 4105]
MSIKLSRNLAVLTIFAALLLLGLQYDRPTPLWDHAPNKFRKGPRRLPRLRIPYANVSELLLPGSPSNSLYASLRPNFRYLTADSWSGLSGQFTSALSLLYLAGETQRIAIIPSWRDSLHYGDSVVKMSELFDLDGLRRTTGALFVEWDDVKPRDLVGNNTAVDQLGCFQAGKFAFGYAFKDHNIQQVLLSPRRPLPAYTTDSLIQFDFDVEARDAYIDKFAQDWELELPPNIAGDKADLDLLCYANVWDLRRAGAGNAGIEQAKLMQDGKNLVNPEWWIIGQHIDFHPSIWDAALEILQLLTIDHRTPLLTVHIRRGDFKLQCPKDKRVCLPSLTTYVAAVDSLSAKFGPKEFKVLVTTDETQDELFLGELDSLGWIRVDHELLGTRTLLAARMGTSNGLEWYEAAVDQAILSLGQLFVGTRHSQVSDLAKLRVETWNYGSAMLVDWQ